MSRKRRMKDEGGRMKKSVILSVPAKDLARHSDARSFGSTLRMTVLAILLLLGGSLARAADVQSQIDWPKFLSRHDLLYSKVPTKWGEAPFTGNGLLGAIVYTTDD